MDSRLRGNDGGWESGSPCTSITREFGKPTTVYGELLAVLYRQRPYPGPVPDLSHPPIPYPTGLAGATNISQAAHLRRLRPYNLSPQQTTPLRPDGVRCTHDAYCFRVVTFLGKLFPMTTIFSHNSGLRKQLRQQRQPTCRPFVTAQTWSEGLPWRACHAHLRRPWQNFRSGIGSRQQLRC